MKLGLVPTANPLPQLIHILSFRNLESGDFQWLGLGTFAAVGLGPIPGQRTRILQAARPKKNKRKFGIGISVSLEL